MGAAMTKPLHIALLALAAAFSTSSVTGTETAKRGGPTGAAIPARTLTCTVGRATNIDTSRIQRIDEIVLEGQHVVAISLPPVRQWQGPTPDPSDPPLPVDKRVRISADPDHILADAGPQFDRVIDMWPSRVEMVARMKPPLGKLIIIHDIAADQSTARVSITSAADAASLDINNMYLGPCRIMLQ
jgi:hypothetical protein